MRGAYVLLLISPGISLRVGGLGEVVLPAGILAYVGSARGPGGLGARIGRHFTKGKVLRWHIDYLTEVIEAPCALAVPGGDESRLVGILSKLGEPIVRGFGCSDRREDRTHLFLVGRELGEVLGRLIPALAGAYLVWNPASRRRG